MNLTELSHYVKFVIVRIGGVDMAKRRRKSFKVMTRRNPYEFDYHVLDNAILREELGYIKNIETETVFVYHNSIDKVWYVIDIFTGLAATHGKTMYIAEKQFKADLQKYRDFKNTETYHNAIKKYNELLKNYMEVIK